MTRGHAPATVIGSTLPAVFAVLLAITIAGCSPPVTVSRWDPGAFRSLPTLEFLTVGPDEGPHWSTVWLVVLEDGVYVRLGSRAAGRMQRNTTAPYVDVRIGGREYRHVHALEAPDMVGRVAAAMAEKYSSDVVVRWVTHPLTMRLEPDPADGK
jgi:hypothetical protein